MKDLVFIASGGRTGTNLFGNRLRYVIDDCWSEHEPDNLVLRRGHPTHRRIADFGLWHMTGAKFGSGLRAIGTRYQNGADSDETIAALRKLRRNYHRRHHESLLVESYYAWWMVADLIEEVFPGARMVGVVRDPHDWIESWLAHNSKRRRGWEPIAKSVRCADWKTMSQIERLAWEWNKIASTLVGAQNRAINVFRFEDLMLDPDLSTLKEMVTFVAQGRDTGDIESLRNRRINTSERSTNAELSKAITAAVNTFASEMVETLGYQRG